MSLSLPRPLSLSRQSTNHGELLALTVGIIRHLHLCHSQEELAALPAGPKVVLASMQSLEVGAARELFTTWASNPKNLLLFTDMGQVRVVGIFKMDWF